jgi:competence protein ComGC
MAKRARTLVDLMILVMGIVAVLLILKKLSK